MVADAAKFARGNCLRTAASCSRVIGQRDWSATMEGCTTLPRASVGVELIVHSLSSSLLFAFKATFLVQYLLSFYWNQLNRMEDPASTTTRSTRMARTSVQTVNTSAPAWTEQLVVSPSVPTWSFYPCWTAWVQSGSRYLEDAVTSLCVQRRLLWVRNTWKNMEKTAESLKTTLLAGARWAQAGEERPGRCQVSTLTLHAASSATKVPQSWQDHLVSVTHAAFRSHPVEHVLVTEVQCESQTTAWSPCSKSCGTGVSTRLTNSNSQCKLVKETRICLIRPCSQMNRHKVLFDFLLHIYNYLCIAQSLKMIWNDLEPPYVFLCLICNRVARNATIQKRPSVLLKCHLQAAVA